MVPAHAAGRPRQSVAAAAVLAALIVAGMAALAVRGFARAQAADAAVTLCMVVDDNGDVVTGTNHRFQLQFGYTVGTTTTMSAVVVYVDEGAAPTCRVFSVPAGASLSASIVLQPAGWGSAPGYPRYQVGSGPAVSGWWVDGLTVGPGDAVTITFHDAASPLPNDIEVTKFRDDSASFGGTAPLAGWSFTLTGGSVNAARVTDAAGKARFAGVPHGTYQLCETVQPGWLNVGSRLGIATQSGTCREVTIGAGSPAVTAVEFYNQPLPGAIHVTMYRDDGADFSGTSPLGGRALTITGVSGAAFGVHTAGTTNGAGGAAVTGIPDGLYEVCEVPQPAWRVVGSRYDGTTQAGSCRTVTLEPGGTAAVAFFIEPRAVIRVQHRLNIVGFERPGAGWEFTLAGCGIAPITLTADASGIAEFTDLPRAVNCSYTVTMTLQPGWTPQFEAQSARPVSGGEIVDLVFLTIRDFSPRCVDPMEPGCTHFPPTPSPTPTRPPSPPASSTPVPAPATPTPPTPTPVTEPAGGAGGPGSVQSPTPLAPAAGSGAASPARGAGAAAGIAGLLSLGLSLGLAAIAGRRR